MSKPDQRVIDYHIKNLDSKPRQEIMRALDNIGLVTIECLLEKEKGYPKYKRMRIYTRRDRRR